MFSSSLHKEINEDKHRLFDHDRPEIQHVIIKNEHDSQDVVLEMLTESLSDLKKKRKKKAKSSDVEPLNP
mgnify:FL=1